MKKEGSATEVMLFKDPTQFTFEQNHASAHANQTQEWLFHNGIDFITAMDAPPN